MRFGHLHPWHFLTVCDCILLVQYKPVGSHLFPDVSFGTCVTKANFISQIATFVEKFRAYRIWSHATACRSFCFLNLLVTMF